MVYGTKDLNSSLLFPAGVISIVPSPLSLTVKLSGVISFPSSVQVYVMFGSVLVIGFPNLSKSCPIRKGTVSFSTSGLSVLLNCNPPRY